MAPTLPIDNQQMASLLFTNNLATREQILEAWPLIRPEKDIGVLLVERGVLHASTYQQAVQYLLQLASPPASSPESRATSPTKRSDSPTVRNQTENTAAAHASRSQPPSTSSPPQQAASSSLQINLEKSLDEMLACARSIDASDFHLSPNSPLLVRRYGSLIPISDNAADPSRANELITAILTPQQRETLDACGDLEFVYTIPDQGRFRITVMKQRAGWDLAARCIPTRVRSFAESGLPQSCASLTHWTQGLVLVTGPASCGKSSTLATFIEMINQSRHDHIIVLESPIEYIFTSGNCQITQREIGQHTQSQESALRAALREDPDVIVLGELRDLETIRLAISAAETGHLVFGTMNTLCASRTIYRLIDAFPPEEQGTIRNMISESLRGVISQQLIPRKDGQGVVPAYEVLIVTPAVANMIRKDEAHQLGTAMITGKAMGMMLLDDSLRMLASQGLIDPAEVAARSIMGKPSSGGKG